MTIYDQTTHEEENLMTNNWICPIVRVLGCFTEQTMLFFLQHCPNINSKYQTGHKISKAPLGYSLDRARILTDMFVTMAD